jgi:NAD(P)-dependent dehydrogenase (short-subunit alcohol dehydrogenase family)
MGILDEKVVLITGTGGGLGRVAAQTFAREGAKVVGCDINVDANNETVELVRRAGGEMTGIAPIDLTHPEQARKMVEDAVAAYGRVDVVYNNASRPYFGPMPDFSIDDWRATITGELDIPFFVSKFAWPHLVRRGGGVIINVASMADMIAGETPPMVGHVAAKAGVIAMTDNNRRIKYLASTARPRPHRLPPAQSAWRPLSVGTHKPRDCPLLPRPLHRRVLTSRAARQAGSSGLPSTRDTSSVSSATPAR